MLCMGQVKCFLKLMISFYAFNCIQHLLSTLVLWLLIPVGLQQGPILQYEFHYELQVTALYVSCVPDHSRTVADGHSKQVRKVNLAANRL